MLSNIRRTAIRTLITVGLAVLTMTATATAALAQNGATRITMEQAGRIALQHVPNATIESIEREFERGVVVYEVELVTQDGVEHELLIDANDGRVIRAHIED